MSPKDEKPSNRIDITNFHFQNRKHKKTLEYYRQILEDNRDNIQAREGIAECFFNLGKLDDAKRECESLISRNHQSWIAYHLLGLILAEQGKLNDAEDLINTSLNIKPDSAILHNSLGSILARQKKLKEAIQAYEKAASLDTNFWKPQHNLARIYLYTKQYEYALDASLQAFKLRPSATTLYWAWVSFESLHPKIVGYVNIVLFFLVLLFPVKILIPLVFLFLIAVLLRGSIWVGIGDRTKGVFTIVIGILVTIWYFYRIAK